MNSILKIVSLLALTLCITAVQAQKFGYLNSAEILSLMPEVKQADANLDALQKQLQKKGQGMVDQLQKDYAAIQEKVDQGELSPKQQQDEAQKLKAREDEIAKFQDDMVKQLQDKRTELLQPIYDKVNKAISEVAKEGGFQFIFDKGVLLFGEDTLDVSTQVKSKLGI